MQRASLVEKVLSHRLIRVCVPYVGRNCRRHKVVLQNRLRRIVKFESCRRRFRKYSLISGEIHWTKSEINEIQKPKIKFTQFYKIYFHTVHDTKRVIG